MKQKILIWCDSPNIVTGFGIVAKNLFSELYKKFEVDIVGINYIGYNKYDSSKWFIYPVQRTSPLGEDVLQKVVSTNFYPVIILFQDIFHISTAIPILKDITPKSKFITYFPVDGGPLYKEWSNTITEADKPITYTKFAVETVKESYPFLSTEKLDYLYHGVEPEFKLLPLQVRNKLRSQFLWSDRFTAININRYQPRKNIPATIRAWSLFSKGYKLCKCGNAYPKNLKYCDANRCGPSSIVKETDPKDDVTLYLHMRLYEKINGPGASNNLHAIMFHAGFNEEDLRSGKLYLQGRDLYASPFSSIQINELYNAADINISTAMGEGVGLSLIESAASGTTSIAPRNSAIIEMLQEHGILVDNVPNGIATQPMDNSFRRPNVDTLKFVEALEKQYKLWKENDRTKLINQKAIKAVKEKFQWEDKRQYFQDEIEKLL